MNESTKVQAAHQVPAGWRETSCEACGAVLLVRRGVCLHVCQRCFYEREKIADVFEALRRLSDEQLIAAIAAADHLGDDEMLDMASSELCRRLDEMERDGIEEAAVQQREAEEEGPERWDGMG